MQRLTGVSKFCESWPADLLRLTKFFEPVVQIRWPRHFESQGFVGNRMLELERSRMQSLPWSLALVLDLDPLNRPVVDGISTKHVPYLRKMDSDLMSSARFERAFD